MNELLKDIFYCFILIFVFYYGSIYSKEIFNDINGLDFIETILTNLDSIGVLISLMYLINKYLMRIGK